MRSSRRYLQTMVLALAWLLLSGCAVVSVKQHTADDAAIARRADVLSSGKLSTDATTSLAAAGLDSGACTRDPAPCVQQLRAAVPVEAWLATAAELQLARLQSDKEAQATGAPLRTQLAADAARWSYAYLFLTPRTPEQRVFESRQQRVLAIYNRAVELLAQATFEASRAEGGVGSSPVRVGELETTVVLHGFEASQLGTQPDELLASDTLGFDNLRAVYRRDGFGSSLVAVYPRPQRDPDQAQVAYRDTRYLPVTVTVRFPGDSLDAVLASRQLRVDAYNPYRIDSETIAGRTVPLAANFSAAYGVWLARSDLAKLSLASLLKPRQSTVFKPRVYLNQPYDPDKRVIVLVHGLASSPEAWVNLANELLGDDELRDQYQVWQVFYPTNLGLLASRQSIDAALQATFRHYDPDGDDAASRDAVLVGHSMGGVIARLLVSDSGERVLDASLASFSPEQTARLRQEPLVRGLTVFAPMPQVGRVVFMAAPHRGAGVADGWALRVVRKLIGLPFEVLRETAELAQRADVDEQALQKVGFRKGRPPTGPDDLSPTSWFMRITAGVPMEPGLPFHTIVGRKDPALPLAQSSDGYVPYASAHLDGAVSELAITSGHSVQETPQAIIELRRILREDERAHAKP
ncbi:alpha/beta hydrolase [Lysobacter sp. Root983]|uniref:esterase/lipase family protein n=1 Tax=Lysobacter sp. Root983 TaxID=1736613 RepID=UPI000ACAD305|nr:alpha/beta hydrolase [Lysobacter sp. Root983]